MPFFPDFLNDHSHNSPSQSDTNSQSTSSNTQTTQRRQKRSSRTNSETPTFSDRTLNSRDLEVSLRDLDMNSRDLEHVVRHRKRRSAAWMLSATIQLCNTHRHLCKRVELHEDDVSMTLNFQDA